MSEQCQVAGAWADLFQGFAGSVVAAMFAGVVAYLLIKADHRQAKESTVLNAALSSARHLLLRLADIEPMDLASGHPNSHYSTLKRRVTSWITAYSADIRAVDISFAESLFLNYELDEVGPDFLVADIILLQASLHSWMTVTAIHGRSHMVGEG